MTRRPENLWDQYHAHVYFDADTLDQARELCIDAWRECHIGVGRAHEKPVGPHPRWSCQLSFDKDEFDRVVPWLDRHRDGLTILVHPLSGDDLADHSDYAAWLGNPVELKLDLFQDN